MDQEKNKRKSQKGLSIWDKRHKITLDIEKNAVE